MAGETVVSFSIGGLRGLLVAEGEYLDDLRSPVDELREKLTIMEGWLEYAEARRDKRTKEVVELADKLIDSIESYVVLRVSSKNIIACFRLRERRIRQKVRSDIEVITTKITDLVKGLSETIKVGGDSASSTLGKAYKVQDLSNLNEDDFVGRKDDIQELVNYLINDDQIRIISILGMGGLGKTTLARKVYKDKRVVSHFEGFAFVCVSQQCQAEAISRHILQQLAPENKEEEIKSMSETEVIEQLQIVYREKSCLVVIDDLWSVDDWKSLSGGLPDGDMAGKVIITTRKEEVAKVGLCYKPDCLTEEEGWKLIQKKIFLPRREFTDMRLSRDAALAAKKNAAEKRSAELKSSASARAVSEALPTVAVLADPAAPVQAAPKAKTPAPLPPSDAPLPKKRRKSHSRGSGSTEGDRTSSAHDSPPPASETAEDPALVLSHLDHSLSGFPRALKGYGARLAEKVFPGEAAKETGTIPRPHLHDITSVLLSEIGACVSSYNVELDQADNLRASLERDIEASKAELSVSADRVSALEGELEKSQADLLAKEGELSAGKRAWRAEKSELKRDAAERVKALEAKVAALAEENTRLNEDAAAVPSEKEVIEKFTASSQYVDEALGYMERSRVQTFRAAFAAGVPLELILEMARYQTYGSECRAASSMVPFDDEEVADIKEADGRAGNAEWIPLPARADNLFSRLSQNGVFVSDSYLHFVHNAASSSQPSAGYVGDHLMKELEGEKTNREELSEQTRLAEQGEGEQQ